MNGLRFALTIFSGKIILKSKKSDRLRSVRFFMFTDGVVTENGICSACFLRKHLRCGGNL
ncbi:MAG TPA: hypothetical protein DCL93_03910 [Faecalibacterium sp.]|nr:hypothetical protein [Faecalibacterium sp.]